MSKNGKAARCSTSGRPKKAINRKGSLAPSPGQVNAQCGHTASLSVQVETAETSTGPARHETPGGRPAETPGGCDAAFSYGHIKYRSDHPSTIPEMSLLLWPQGFETVRTGKAVAGQDSRGIRGEITGFSWHSAKRLRRKLMQLEGPDGWERWAWTLTIRREVDAAEWRRIWHKFILRLRRAGIPIIWRVELQKRGVPHIHFVGWLREKRDQRIIREGWLESTGEIDDSSAWRYAVKGNPVASDREFSSYVAAHTSKGKTSQLGWKGRQWGIVNSALLREVKPVELAFTVPGQVLWFSRFLERYLRTLWKGRKRRIRVSRTNGQCRFLEPAAVRRLLDCSARVAIARAKPPAPAITRADLEAMKIIEKSC